MDKHELAITRLLVIRSQMGDRQALDELVDKWQERLWRHAYNLTGDEDAAWDTVQDAWLAIVRGIGKLADSSSFPRWAYAIVGNKCADWISRRKRARQTIVDLQEPANCRNSLDAHDQEEHGLRYAMGKLSGDLREILSLHYAEGLAVKEIADTLDIPEGTVKSRLHSAREQIRSLMEMNDDG